MRYIQFYNQNSDCYSLRVCIRSSLSDPASRLRPAQHCGLLVSYLPHSANLYILYSSLYELKMNKLKIVSNYTSLTPDKITLMTDSCRVENNDKIHPFANHPLSNTQRNPHKYKENHA